MESIEKATTTYHRMTEIFKFSHSYRSHLSDPDFVANKEEFKKVRKYDNANDTMDNIAIMLCCFRISIFCNEVFILHNIYHYYL